MHLMCAVFALVAMTSCDGFELNWGNGGNGDNEEDKWTFLYDIKNDPWETKNLAQEEAYADKISEMRGKIISHRDEWEEQSHPWGVDFWKRF